jgi:diphthamide biosynthesis protein 2
MEYTYRIPQIISLVKLYKYRSVILQFPDNLVHESPLVYQYFLNNLDDVDVFILADSSFGSSVDDISASHVQGEVLVYFGEDLSCSSQIPIIISPYQEPLPELFNMDLLYDTCMVDKVISGRILLLFDPKYYSGLVKSIAQCSFANRVVMASLPPNSDLMDWSPSHPSKHSMTNVSLGGLIVENDFLSEADMAIWYVGDNLKQLRNISFYVPEKVVYAINPKSNEISQVVGHEIKEFNARYGGIAKVKEASVIGLIIGSMGIDSGIFINVVERLSTLITASNKKCVVIVAGKLTESKLGNFPEIDIFCLIGNELSALIKPKTFHVPVITPWELELGLGARPWESMYSTDLTLLLSLPDKSALTGVRAFNKSDDDIEAETDPQSTSSHVSSEYLQLVVKNSETTVAVKSNNSLFDRFSSKEYKGLVPSSDMSVTSQSIEPGLYGTAKGYVKND